MLFQPFSQIDSSLSRRYEGTGLGLVMVKKLAELHGGKVAVQSEQDKGSTFTVWLPWRVGPDAEAELESLQAGTSSMPCPPVKKSPADSPQPAAPAMEIPRIVPQSAPPPLALVVEDDDMASNLLRILLEASGFRVICAATAELGLELAADQKPALIALDIMLPGISGWDFLERIKANPLLTDIPVIIESILSTPKIKGFSMGAAAVLQKPVHREDLFKAIGDIGLIAAPGKNLSVLVVDDDPMAVDLIGTYLESAGYTVLRAFGGKQAIDIVQRLHPDLMILDLMMPEINGFDVVDALKDEAPPILIVTAKIISDEDRRKLNGHVQEILEKSEFNREHFLNEVRRAMAASINGKKLPP